MTGNRLVLACGLAAACARPVPANHSGATQPVVAPAPILQPSAKVDALLAWPVPRATAAQIAEVKHCAAKKQAAEVYPATVTLEALPAASSLHGACDEAILAVACAKRLDSADPPKACLDAYARAVMANPAFAFADGLVGGYFGKLAIVAPPPVALHALVGLTLDYKWTGTGTARAWHVEIRTGTGTGKPQVTVTGATAKPDVDLRDTLEAFRGGLVSLLPIAHPIAAIHCTDSYPEWKVRLDFAGAGTVELANHRSNLIGIGGPLQTSIGGVTYLQLGPQLTLAIADLVEALGLPRGAAEVTTCSHYDFESAVLK